jgi:DNA (cytosine-5)-methyltransferase 1
MAVINLELYCCSGGGMAEGFRRAGIPFDVAIDFAPDHCDSYERNLGHRPIAMDVRDLLRLVLAGLVRWEVDLLVADPPCTPWSRAGKRRGTADERDMLAVTCELIAALRPRRYLIGNVPGLDDAKNLPIVRRHIGGLAKHGYCTADFARLDAADYGVPQHRHRPFWFGHRAGPCVRWTAPTHGDPLVVAAQPAQVGLAGIGAAPLIPWVTCRQALGHLEGDDLGRPVRMRKRNDNGKQKGSVADRPARVVGTSNLSDGNVLTYDQHHPDWPWTRPAMRIQRDDRIAPAGHHGESQPDAVILSERAAAILQGFPDTWVFSGTTKRVRWSQLGQAMPPPLAEAVARAVVSQDRATGEDIP